MKCALNDFSIQKYITFYNSIVFFQMTKTERGIQRTLEKEYTGLGAAFGFVQTLVAPGMSSLVSCNNSAEYDGLAGMMGDRQHTLMGIKRRREVFRMCAQN